MQPAEYACPTCGNPLRLRRSRLGEFWGCSTYPQCRVALARGAKGEPVAPAETGVRCDECGAPTIVKRGPSGPFLGCSNYPRCRWTKAMDRQA